MKSFLCTGARWTQKHPRTAGVLFATLLLPALILLGDRAPWLIFVPILAAIIFTLPGEMAGRQVQKKPSPPSLVVLGGKKMYSGRLVIGGNVEGVLWEDFADGEMIMTTHFQVALPTNSFEDASHAGAVTLTSSESHAWGTALA